jgi:uncharacterized membrane-anchored protein YitT (DUF2179 family)
MNKQKNLRTVSIFEQYLMMTVGIVLMVMGFYYFIIPADLVTGGVTGIGLVINKLSNIKISYIVFAFNILLLFVGLFMLGKKTFYKSIYGSLMFPIILFLFEQFGPALDTEGDYVIAVTFGGVLLGLGFGLVIKYGGTSGGTDIPVKILNKKFKLPISWSIYISDGLIILFGVIVFYEQYGINAGLYAILTVYISGVVADQVVMGRISKKAVQIITDKPNEIKEAIYETIHRGVTLVNIEGGYSKQSKTMLITVITKKEYFVLKNIVATIDESAFVYVTSATEIHGDFVIEESE